MVTPFFQHNWLDVPKLKQSGRMLMVLCIYQLIADHVTRIAIDSN